MRSRSYDFRARSDASRLFFDDVSLVKPEFQKACDINNILKKYSRNGVNPFVVTQDARFGDYSADTSYHEAMNLVASAAEQFAALPAVLRKRFDNDPAQLLRFLGNESNRDEAIKLGLVQKLDNSDPKNKNPASPVNGAEGSGSA